MVKEQGVEVALVLEPLVSGLQAEVRRLQQDPDGFVVALLVQKADFAFPATFAGRAQCHVS